MHKLGLTFLVFASAGFGVWACSDSTPSGVTSTSDASDAPAGDAGNERGAIGDPDSATIRCTLESSGDPVALCTQKDLLKGLRFGGYSDTAGAYVSWDSTSFMPDTDDGGAPLHDFRDDLAFAASISNYHVMAGLYGDNEITADLDNVIVKLASKLETEIATPPDDYDGDTYVKLRLVSAGLRYINENDHATKIDAIAETYVRRIYTAFYQPVTVGDAGANDAVFGTSLGGTQIAYDSAKVATAAYALLDMAVRHASDDPTNANKWQLAAKRAFDHLWSRARDVGTKLYFRSLVTSNDVDHDTVAASIDANPDDALLTDVQARIILTLLRAQDLLRKNPSALPALAGYPLQAHAEDALFAMNAATVALWDSSDRGYFEGWVPSTSTRLTNKTTAGNALMFGALHRQFMDDPPADAGPGSLQVVQLKALRSLLIDRTKLNASLFSVLPNQQVFLRASSADYHFASLPGDAGTESRAASYNTRATAAALEGMNEQIYGVRGM